VSDNNSQDNPESKNLNTEKDVPKDSGSEQSKRSLKKVLSLFILGVAVIVGLFNLGKTYLNSQALLSITSTEMVSPNGGEIQLTYRNPITWGLFRPTVSEIVDSEGKQVKAKFTSELSDDGLIETVRFRSPTPFNSSLQLRSLKRQLDTSIAYRLGLTPIPVFIDFTTPYEIVSINDLIPTAAKIHSPEALNNQIAIAFNGNVGSTYKKRVKLKPREVPFIELSPLPSGYFQWSDNSTITFNFTAERPRFETKYQFKLTPEKLLNADYQKWEGDTEIVLGTSSNDVYVNDVSVDDEINWNTPITFEFSGNMVGVFDLNKEKTSSVMPVRMNPNVDGVWKWVNARTVEFKPGELGWPIRKNVSIQFQPEVNTESDRNWTNNRDLNEITFYVKPRLQSITHVNLRGEGVDPEAELQISFSRDLIARDQWEMPLPLNDKNAPVVIEPEISGTYQWRSGRTLVIETQTPWSELTDYKITIHPNFNPDRRFEWAGTKAFKFKTAENIITPKFYAIPEAVPSGSEFFGNKAHFTVKDTLAPEQQLWIEFNRPFGKHRKTEAELQKGIQISPAVEGEFEWLSDTLLAFSPSQGWLPKTDYTIQLTNDLLYFSEQHYRVNRSTLNLNIDEDAIVVKADVTKVVPHRPVTLKFNKQVDTMVKVGRQYLSTEVESSALPLAWEMNAPYQFEWTAKDTLVLTPQPYWPALTKANLVFNEQLLPRPQSFWSKDNPTEFATVENIVGISNVQPAGKASRSTELEIVFNKNIKPNTLALGAIDNSGLVTVTPEIEGDWVWQAENKLILKPTATLLPSSNYDLTIHPENIYSREFTWFDLDKDKKPISKSYRFHTPYQRIKQANALYEFDEENVLKQRFLIDVELAEPSTYTEFEKRFTLWTRNNIDGKTVEVPLIYQITTDDEKANVRSFRVVSEFVDRPNEDRRVYFQVEKGLPAINANATMSSDFKSDFLQEKPRFIKIQNVTWKRVDGKFSASLRLNAPVEPEKLKAVLNISHHNAGDSLPYELSVDSNYQNNRNFAYLIERDFEPALRYDFVIKEGLLAADGALTNEVIEYNSTTPGLERKADFGLQGNVLSRYDAQQIPILTSNVSWFNLDIDQVYPSNVRNYLNSGLSNYGNLGTAGKSVFSQHYNTEALHSVDYQNIELTTHVNLETFFDDNRRGLYRIQLESDNTNKHRWFLSTDIGLVSRKTEDYIYVWAMSLADAEPLAGVSVELVDYWNQTVSSGITNSEGFIRLENVNPANTHIVVASQGDDFSFLDFRTQNENFNGYDVSGVKGINDASLLQSYVYSDRGVYRPGDLLHVVAVTRNQEGGLPQKESLVVTLRGPTGVERLQERFSIDSNGIFTLDYDIPVDAKTGKWRAEVNWGNDRIGQMNFQVEEFIPNKIKVELNATNKSALPGKVFTFGVQANNLFGPPAAGRKVNGQVSLRPAYFKPAGFSDYEFGHDDKRFTQLNTDLVETRLDDKGHHQYEYSVPEGVDSPIGMNLHYSATVIDDSGRGVAEYAQVPIHMYEQYVGVKRSANSTIELGDSVVFETVNVRANGDAVSGSEQNFNYEVFRKRKVTHYRKNERGYYRYVTEKIDVPVTEYVSPENRFEFETENSGEHFLQVTDLNGGQVTRYYFNVIGQRDSVSIVEAPESVILKLRDRKPEVGGTVTIDVQAPFAGQLLVMGERDEVLFSETYEMDSNFISVTLPIDEAHYPNFYLSAIVVQPASKGSRRQPVYATGLLNVSVFDSTRNPKVTIDAPDKVAPNGKLTVNVAIDDLSNGDVYFTLAAVDEGILDLTKFKTPDMSKAFRRKHRLTVGHYSIYPWVMPYDDDILESITPSGSAPSRALIKKKRENPDSAARVKSVALWSGLQKFEADGSAQVTFDIPEFDGRLKLMLVTFGDQRYNSTDAKVVVRDDLVLKPSLPRFMATADHFELPINLFNSTEQDGVVSVSIESSDHVDLLGNNKQVLNIGAGGEAQTSFSFNVQKRLGIADFVITANGLGETTVKRIQVPVRSSGNYVSLSDGGLVDAATPKTIQIPKVFELGTENQALRISPAGLLEFTGSLGYLLQYPHGCLEQTTSKLFPLLYFEDFAKGADFPEFNTGTPRYFVREGIAKIERMQLENGYFSYWSGGENVNHYAFLYAAHFLAEARSKGLDVNETVWNNMQYRLQDDALNLFGDNADYKGRYHLSHQVYALYILALSGNPKISEMNYLLEYQTEKLRLHDRARLAAAYKLAGRTKEAKGLLSDVTNIREYDDAYRQNAGTFASNTRDLAILLDALIEVDPQSDAVPLVIDKLGKSRRYGRWSSTQENALALMALGKSINKSAKTQQGDVIVTLPDGKELVNESVDLSTIDLLSGEVSVRTTGDAEANYFWQADGISAEEVNADDDSRIKVRRQYFSVDQTLVNLEEIKQGDLVVVEITMESLSDTVENVAVTDLLPMGLEIENARLSTSADVPWLKSTAEVDHVDIRDDRMNLYLTLTEREVKYYYTTRAVTVGHFTIPSIRAEAMYDESRYSISSAGQLKVLPMQ